MARLAAYYQEDFHYPQPIPYKHRKSYVYYEEPRHRQRSLGSSHPALAPPYDPYYDAAYQPRERSRKRLSYAEQPMHDGYMMDNYYAHRNGMGPPMQDPWVWSASPGYLSPLDSGLSSQSSPSMEWACLCHRAESRFDSGRSSPGGSVSAPRYGRLGIVGEVEPRRERAEKSPGSQSPLSVSSSGAELRRAGSTMELHRPPSVLEPRWVGSGSESPGSVGSAVEPRKTESRAERRREDTEAEHHRAGEREIRELEDMVERCGLSDRDLFDRAERRDLPTPHQGRLARSSSDTLYETRRVPALPHPRAPPLRRSGLPDRVADDMAQRKLRRPHKSRPTHAPDTTTYMLCSAHFTPSVPTGRDILLLDSPDIELDDFSYRRHYLGRQSRETQPPFGIPLRPPPPERGRNDYLHAVPSRAPRPLCHPRGNPDIVRDDMAFRTLRKEDPERIYCDIAQVYEKKR